MESEETHHLQSRATPQQEQARRKLERLYTETPIPLSELLVNLGLYFRASAFAKLLYLDELYRLILGVPGVIMEFGVWWGQNLVMFQNLRAIHEPYEHTRKIIGFDTFEGYPNPTAEDGGHDLVKEGQYSVSPGYVEHLEGLLEYHESENVMSQVRKYELVVGDAAVEVERYLGDHPETIVSLAYFDMQLYEPTKACLEAIRPRLVKGSVIAMDELNNPEFPGETQAFAEAIGLTTYRLHKSRFLPDRSFLIIE